MTTSSPESLAQRQLLAAALRKLRLAADLTSYDLADRTSLSQAKVSRIENARKVPTTSEIQEWARATGASEAQRDEVLELADHALTEVITWRTRSRSGHVANQQYIGQLEASAATLRIFHPVIIPGLLQTAEYARKIFAAGDFPTRPGPADPAAAAAARLERQAVLYDQGKRIEIVTTEAAVRQRFGSREATLAQLDRISSLTSLPNLSIGLIPLATEVTTWRFHGFNLYDDRGDDADGLVIVTALSGSTEVVDPQYVDAYRTAFARLQHVAVFGSDARALLADIGDELR